MKCYTTDSLLDSNIMGGAQNDSQLFDLVQHANIMIGQKRANPLLADALNH